MTLRSAGAVRKELAQLALPMPLEVLVLRAINAEGADGCHERLVYAWEIAIQISASACWAVCRHLDLRSDALDAIRSKLARPAFGHWVELLRASRALLAGRKEAAAIGLAPLLDGLERKWEEDPRFVALAERMRTLPKKPIKVGGRTVAALLDAMPAYRNETRGHGEPDTEFRDASIEALANGLVAFAKTAPLIGDYRIAVVHRLERDEGGGHSAELAMMERTLSGLESIEGVSGDLKPARAYLRGRDDSFVALFPAAAAVRGDDGWALGWMKQQVRVPTVSFESSIAGAFSLAIDRGELETLFKSEDDTKGAASEASAEVLALEPWRGLLAYGEEHKELFFGRAGEVVALGSRLVEKGAVVLCGASGSGKSSLMRAGLLPRLRAIAAERGAELAPVVFFPGAHPIEALRAALLGIAPGEAIDAARWSVLVDDMVPKKSDGLVHLARGLAAGGRHLALLIDQLEEAATLCADAAERQTFLDLVCALARDAASANAVVVGTVRADKLGSLLEHEGLRELVRKGLEPVATLGRDALLEVVTGPLRGRRVAIEAGLAERIAADVGDEPGGLALVSQVLASLWDERGRHGDRLTIAAYDALGGVSGVLGSQAEQARRESEGAGVKLDAVLVQLAQRGADGAFTRRRIDVAALAESVETSAAELDRMIEPFVKRRLLVVGDGTVEVAHEMLLRGWITLRELLDREGAVTELRQQVEHAAGEWEGARSRGERGELWSDATSNLRRAEELLAERRMPLSRREVAFLEASRRAAQRAIRLRRIAMAIVGVLSIAAMVLAWVAFNSYGAAQAHFVNAQYSIQVARGAFLAQASAPSNDWAGRSEAIMGALRAIELEDRLDKSKIVDSHNGLSAAVTQGRSLIDGYVVEGSAVPLPPDRLAVFAERGSSLGLLRIYRASTHGVALEVDGVRGYVGANGDKLWLLFDGGYEILDARTGAREPAVAVEWAIAAGPDRWVGAARSEGTPQTPIILVDGHGKLLATIHEKTTFIDKQRDWVKVSTKAGRIALASPVGCHGCAHALVDARDGHVVADLPSSSDTAFSEDGTAFFVLREDGKLERRDPVTGSIVETVASAGDGTMYPSGDGRHVLVVRHDPKALVVLTDMKPSGGVADIDETASRGWVDGQTFFDCPKCKLYSAGEKKGAGLRVEWARDFLPLGEPCRLLASGAGLFARISCDGKTVDRVAVDSLLDSHRPLLPLENETLLAKSTPASGQPSVKVWPRAWPSVAIVVAPPGLHQPFVDTEAQRIFGEQRGGGFSVTDRDGKELWRYAEGVSWLGKHGELGAAVLLDPSRVDVFDGPGHRKLYSLQKDVLPAESRVADIALDGRLMVVVGKKSAAAFEPTTAKPIGGVFPIEEDSVLAEIADDGCHFALRVGEKFAVWDACAKKKVFEVEAGTEGRFVFSADAKRAVAGGSKSPLKVYDVARGVEIATIAQADARYHVALSGDGSRVAARGEKGTVSIWNVATPGKSTSIPDSSRMGALSMSRDGRHLLIADDTSTRVYEAEYGTIVATVQGYPGRPAFLGEDRVAVVRGDHFVIWKLGEADLRRAACWHAHFRSDYADVKTVCAKWVAEIQDSLR